MKSEIIQHLISSQRQLYKTLETINKAHIACSISIFITRSNSCQKMQIQVALNDVLCYKRRMNAGNKTPLQNAHPHDTEELNDTSEFQIRGKPQGWAEDRLLEEPEEGQPVSSPGKRRQGHALIPDLPIKQSVARWSVFERSSLSWRTLTFNAEKHKTNLRRRSLR